MDFKISKNIPTRCDNAKPGTFWLHLNEEYIPHKNEDGGCNTFYEKKSLKSLYMYVNDDLCWIPIDMQKLSHLLSIVFIKD